MASFTTPFSTYYRQNLSDNFINPETIPLFEHGPSATEIWNRMMEHQTLGPFRTTEGTIQSSSPPESKPTSAKDFNKRYLKWDLENNT